MKKAFKWVLLIGAGAAVVVLAAVIAIALFFDIHQLKPQIEKQLSAATGRPVILAGDLRISFYPWMGLSIFDMRIGNSPPFSEKDFLTLKSLELRVKLLPLFKREIQVRQFVAKSPRIVLVKNANGQMNWSGWDTLDEIAGFFLKGEHSPSQSPPLDFKALFNSNLWPRSFKAGTLSVSNGTILWVDHSQKRNHQISEIDIHIKDASLTQPVSIRFACSLDSYPLSGNGTIGPLDQALANDILSCNLKLRLFDQMDMHLTGQIDNLWANPFLKCAVQLYPFSPRRLMTAVRQDFPFATSDPRTFQRLALKADLSGPMSNLSLKNGSMRIDDTVVNFSMSLRNLQRVQISLDADMDSCNLNRYLPPPIHKKIKGQKDGFWGDLLRQTAIAGTLRIKSVSIGRTRLTNIHLNAGGSMGNYTFRFMKMDLLEGKGSGTIRININKAKPFFRLNGQLKGFETDKLARSLRQQKRIKGPMDIAANVTTSGTTLKEWTRNLNGAVIIKGNRLLLNGLDIDKILKKYEETQNFGVIGIGSFFIIGPFGPLLAAAYENVDAAVAISSIGKGQSLINALISDWKIEDGVAVAQDVAFSTSKNRVAVNGSINIATQQFENLKFASIDADGCIKFSQTIHGSFHQPEIEKTDLVSKHIIGPFQSLFRKTLKMAGAGCKTFYSGKVPHPVR